MGMTDTYRSHICSTDSNPALDDSLSHYVTCDLVHAITITQFDLIKMYSETAQLSC